MCRKNAGFYFLSFSWHIIHNLGSLERYSPIAKCNKLIQLCFCSLTKLTNSGETLGGGDCIAGGI